MFLLTVKYAMIQCKIHLLCLSLASPSTVGMKWMQGHNCEKCTNIIKASVFSTGGAKKAQAACPAGASVIPSHYSELDSSLEIILYQTKSERNDLYQMLKYGDAWV